MLKSGADIDRRLNVIDINKVDDSICGRIDQDVVNLGLQRHPKPRYKRQAPDRRIQLAEKECAIICLPIGPIGELRLNL